MANYYGYDPVPYMQANRQALYQAGEGVKAGMAGVAEAGGKIMATVAEAKKRQKTLKRQADVLSMAAENYKKYIGTRWATDPEVSKPEYRMAMDVPMGKTPEDASEEELEDRVVNLNRAVSAMGSWIMGKDPSVKPETLQAIAVYGPNVPQTVQQRTQAAGSMVEASRQPGYGAPTQMPNGAPISYEPGPEGQQYYTPEGVATPGMAAGQLQSEAAAAGLGQDPAVASRAQELRAADVSQRQASAMQGTNTQAEAYAAGLRAVPEAGAVTGGAEQVAKAKPTDYQISRLAMQKARDDISLKARQAKDWLDQANILSLIRSRDASTMMTAQSKSAELKALAAQMQKQLGAAKQVPQDKYGTPIRLDPDDPTSPLVPVDDALIASLASAAAEATAGAAYIDAQLKGHKGAGGKTKKPETSGASPTAGAGARPPLSFFRR